MRAVEERLRHLGTCAARGAQETNGAFRIWDWAYGGLPPNNAAIGLEPPLRTAFTGIHLAGPNLTPETFRDGLFRYPPSGGGPTEPQISRGDHGVWPETDLGGTDDAAIIWFDPTATGEDEVGNQGVGLYRYANGGQRYTLGDFPDTFEEAGLFDNASSVTIFDQVPPRTRRPNTPPPITQCPTFEKGSTVASATNQGQARVPAPARGPSKTVRRRSIGPELRHKRRASLPPPSAAVPWSHSRGTPSCRPSGYGPRKSRFGGARGRQRAAMRRMVAASVRFDTPSLR